MDDKVSNVFDYLHWRGDLSIKQSPFNNVDALILCRLSYIPFDEFLSETFSREAPCVPQICGLRLAHIKDRAENARNISEEDVVFMENLCKSGRFANTRMTCYENRLDHVLEKQFSATTFLLGDGTTFVGFRGTDNTLIGIKEDLNMSFSDNLPGQLEAVRYLEMAAGKVRGDLRVGGHSKGGNFAVFSSAFCKTSVQKRIKCVYNLDGPGFTDKIIKREGFQRIVPKVRTFLPQSSIIGQLLEHEDEYTVIHSNASNGFLQHHLYSWAVYRDGFVNEPEFSQMGRFFDLTFKNMVEGMTCEDREEVVDAVFRIFQETGATTVQELIKLRNSIPLMKAVAGMNDHTQALLKETVSVMAESMKDAYPETLGKA